MNPPAGSEWRHPTLGVGVVSYTPGGRIVLTFPNGQTAAYRDASVFHASVKPAGSAAS